MESQDSPTTPMRSTVISKIVLAVDDTEHSRRAVDFTGDFARQVGANVEVVHFTERIYSRMGAADIEDSGQTTTLVKEVVERLQSLGISAEGSLGVTHPTAEAAHIVQAAHEAKADLIVVGTRGLSAGRATLQGSVSHDLIHSSDVPVLVVP